MKRLALFLLLSSAAFAQLSSTGSITTNAANCNTTNVCIALTLFNTPAISTVFTAIQVTGTWTGTLSFEASVDGFTFVAVPAAPVAGGATVTSTTANGTWVANIQALQQIRVRGSAAMTGAAVILLQASTASSGYPFPNYSVASLPLFLPIGTLAIATDSNGGSCTAGGGVALALCRWSGAAWVPVTAAGVGGGTVTNTGGALTANAIVLGAGGADTKVSTGLTTDGTAGINVGATGVGGTITLFGSASGSNTFTAPGNGTQLSLSANTIVIGTTTASIKSANGLFTIAPLNGGITLTPAGALNTSISVNNLVFSGGKGQHILTQAANNDMAGVCSGTVTTCAVVFTTNYTATPSCVVTPTTAGVTSFIITAQAVSGFTVTYAPSATTNFNYVCIGDPN